MIDEENTDCLYLQRSPYAEMWWEMYSVLSSALSWSGVSGVNYCSEFCSSRKLDSADSVNMFGVKFNFSLLERSSALSPCLYIWACFDVCVCYLAHIYSVSLETLCCWLWAGCYQSVVQITFHCLSGLTACINPPHECADECSYVKNTRGNVHALVQKTPICDPASGRHSTAAAGLAPSWLGPE